ncbi:MAG: membrane protein insertase YidC [Deltaproteobacteria bacterium]|nr:membrane protein insertase YidC [Deltaproteobacteria bacterium]
MDTQRAFIAVVLSLLILLGYQYFFIPSQPPQEIAQTTEQSAPETGAPALSAPPAQPITASPEIAEAAAPREAVARVGRDIPVETSHYSGVVSETGGGLKSFKLKKYKESTAKESDLKELVKTSSPQQLPLFFSWGANPEQADIPLYLADKEQLTVSGEDKSLTLQSRLPSGLVVTRTLLFSDNDYLIHLAVDVQNTSTEHQLQGAPFLALTNKPFTQQKNGDSFVFTGPALYKNGALEEIKTDDLKKGPLVRDGKLEWVGYEDTYFMTCIIPDDSSQGSVHLNLTGDDAVSTVLSGDVVVLPPQSQKRYSYTLYFGPKELRTLKSSGHNLDKIINFGWFDVLAKPMLYLLNFLYGYLHNYGLAIILVTVIIKALFWPIAHKGMKSMKTLQKLQPKMAKLREKYANDKEKLNREMIQLYQTYKVNPMGGCLPMVLQIPVFFALYKVLLQTIELRHAPFMLWIADLSAPDRLYIGFDIPVLGGIPVLTLLMGGTMFLQQKMTPTAADPTQAKIMMFLPVVFTFMFINFASGLVLYWFVNNLLSIAQQYVINRAD